MAGKAITTKGLSRQKKYSKKNAADLCSSPPQVNIMQNALCDLATVRKTPQMAAGYLRHAV